MESLPSQRKGPTGSSKLIPVPLNVLRTYFKQFIFIYFLKIYFIEVQLIYNAFLLYSKVIRLCVYIYFSYSFPLWFITGYWIQFPVLYSRTLLFIHSVYNSLHLLMSNSQSIPPPPHLPLGNHKSVLYVNQFIFRNTAFYHKFASIIEPSTVMS